MCGKPLQEDFPAYYNAQHRTRNDPSMTTGPLVVSEAPVFLSKGVLFVDFETPDGEGPSLHAPLPVVPRRP